MPSTFKSMPCLIAIRQLYGDFCKSQELGAENLPIPPGGYFWVGEDEARQLEASGLAKRWVSRYETKVIVPGVNAEAPQIRAEVQPMTATPFRNLPNSDEEPPALAAVRSATSAVPDVQEPGDTDPRRRRGRPRLNPE